MTGILLIITATLFWAVDTLFRYPLLFSGYSTWHIVWIEHLMLIAITVPWIWRKGLRSALAQKQNWLPFIVIGVLGSAIGTLAFTKAFGLINPTIVILLQKLQPLVAITLAYLVLKEQISRSFLLGALLCLLGSLLLVANEIQSLASLGWASVQDNSGLGILLALLAVVCWGAATVYGKKLTLNKVDSAAIVSGRFLFGFVALTPWLLMFPAELQKTDFNLLQNVSIMVILSGILGMTFYYQGLKRIPSRTSALAEMFFPVAAISVNWVFLDASLTIIQLAGAALLCLGSLQAQKQFMAAPQ